MPTFLITIIKTAEIEVSAADADEAVVKYQDTVDESCLDFSIDYQVAQIDSSEEVAK